MGKMKNMTQSERSVLIGKRLKELRVEARLKKIEVIEYLDISNSAYRYYECDTEFSTNHKRNLGITIRNLIKLAELFKCSTDYILGLSDEKEITR